MSLTTDQVRHIAKLCRLQIAEADAERFAKELSSIVQFIDQLSEVNTDAVEPLHQPTGLHDRMREDVVLDPLASGEDLLNTSPLPILDRQIQTHSSH